MLGASVNALSPLPSSKFPRSSLEDAPPHLTSKTNDTDGCIYENRVASQTSIMCDLLSDQRFKIWVSDQVVLDLTDSGCLARNAFGERFVDAACHVSTQSYHTGADENINSIRRRRHDRILLQHMPDISNDVGIRTSVLLECKLVLAYRREL